VNNDIPHFGNFIKSLRREQFLSQRQIAAKAKLAVDTIVRVEKMKDPFSLNPSTVRSLAAALQFSSPQSLLERAKENNKPTELRKFGAVLQWLRQEVRHMSQQELADAAKLNRRTIERLEREAVFIGHQNNYRKIAKALGMTPAELDKCWKTSTISHEPFSPDEWLVSKSSPAIMRVIHELISACEGCVEIEDFIRSTYSHDLTAHRLWPIVLKMRSALLKAKGEMQ
jgi:transcriptional regulator with XRE-family HTH domain